MAMTLHIASPLEKREVAIAWIELNTSVGNFVIQAEHAPMVLTLQPLSVITYRLQTGKEERRRVSHGVAHITRSTVTLLLSE